MRFLSSLLLAAVLAVPALAQTGGTPLDGLLRPDGTLDPDRARGAGSLDLSGFDVSMTPVGLRAVPQSASRAAGDWSPVGTVGMSAFDDDVQALAVAPDGTIYAAGGFETVGGTPALHVAAYLPGGSTWTALGAGLEGTVFETVIAYSLAVGADGTLYVGGVFSQAGGIPANRIASYNPDTGAWSALGSGTTSVVYALAMGSDGTLYVGGSFSSIGGLSVQGIASYSTGTGTWGTLGTGVDGGGEDVLTIHMDEANEVLYIGGSFASVNGVPAANIAAYDQQTSTWGPLNAGTASSTGGSGSVRAIATGADGTVYAGGRFDLAGGVSVENVAAYAPGTDTWSALGSGPGSTDIQSLAVTPDGTLSAGGNDMGGVYAWDGVSWTESGGVSGRPVEAMVVNGTDLIAAASTDPASSFNAEPTLVQIHDGTGWSAVGPTHFDEPIVAAVYADDGTLYVGGAFQSTPDGLASGLASFDGTAWSEVGGGIRGADSPFVSSLEFGAAGELLVAGGFERAGSTTASNLAVWDGATWDALGGGADSDVYTFLEASDGSLYAGGRSIQLGASRRAA